MPDWYYERLEVCENCRYNSKNSKLTIKEKILYFLNSLEPFCKICFCNLKAKASIADPDESDCGMVNLGEESKWKHIKIR